MTDKKSKFDIGKDIIKKSEVSFTQGDNPQTSASEKKLTRPLKNEAEKQNIKVSVYFTTSEMEQLKEALLNEAKKANSLPKMASFLHDIVINNINNT